MDDLNQQINQILSDPQSMQQLQSMASALGLTSAAPPEPQTNPPQSGNSQTGGPQPGGLDPSALAGLLGSLGGGAAAPMAPAAPAASPELIQTVTKLAPLLSQVNREDDSTRLLRALRPLLGEARQKKLDEAIKILQMMRLLPLLKESGVFSGLLSGLL